MTTAKLQVRVGNCQIYTFRAGGKSIRRPQITGRCDEVNICNNPVSTFVNICEIYQAFALI
jgi:hypothetical protein